MTSLPLWGTIVNTVAVLLGALVGVLIKNIMARGAKREQDASTSGELTKKSTLSESVMRALGLCVILIGVSGALQISNVLVMIVSMAIGTAIGEWLDLDGLVNRLGKWIEKRLGRGEGSIAEGFVTATLLFCVGAMTVTGAMESGIAHTHTTYYAKSLIDMVSALIFASTMGVGVALSAASIFLLQGTLTLVASMVAGAIPVLVTGEIIATGSLLVVGIGTNLLGVTRLKVMNMLPAMFLPLALCPLFSLFPM